ncbi:hypothetical protein GCM10025734_46010 [Kitasatospora paranensis]
MLVVPGLDVPADQAAGGEHPGPGGGRPAGRGQAVGVGAGEEFGAVRDGVPEAGVDRAADPFSCSTSTCTGKGAPTAKARTRPAVRSVEPLSTTSRVKSVSCWAASARRVPPIRSSSWYAGTTTQSRLT